MTPVWVPTVSTMHLGVHGLDVDTVDNQRLGRESSLNGVRKEDG
jgi:hypothetical protein